MKSLFAFSSGGGSGFPGSPIGAVYVAATTPEFLAICAEIIEFPAPMIVIDASIASIWWITSGNNTMFLFRGTVNNISEFPMPGTVDGITFVIDYSTAIYNEDTSLFYQYQVGNWVPLA